LICIAAAVLDADDRFDVRQGMQRLDLERQLGQDRNVVQHHRQGQFLRDVPHVIDQFRLAGREVIRRGQHDRGRPRVGRDVSQMDGFDERRIRDSD
jgi:hypothetical protein